jgi:hypothetical protein
MTVAIRPIEPSDIEPARQLLLANGWSGARFAADRFPALVAGALQTLVAVDDTRVVGFARALGDGVGLTATSPRSSSTRITESRASVVRSSCV